MKPSTVPRALLAALVAASSPPVAGAFVLPPTPAAAPAGPGPGPGPRPLPAAREDRRDAADADADRRRRRPSFDEIQSIESRLASLARDGPELLSRFYEPHLKSFSVRPGSVEAISVTSTCFALQAIFAGGDGGSAFADAVDLDLSPRPPGGSGKDASSSSKIPVRGVVKALLRARWREEDLFQVPLLLHTVLRVDSDRLVLNSDMDEELRHRVRKLVAATLTNRPKRRSGMSQPLSDYILYHITESLATLVESTPTRRQDGGDGDDVGLGGLPESALPDGAASDALLALTRCVEVSSNELCRQLAFRSAGDPASFDVKRLAYSLLTYVRASGAMSGTAGREVVPGDGPASGTRVGRPNRRLVRAALAAFFEEQNDDGTWDQGQPIFKTFRRAGRDVGNAYVFEADTVSGLLGALPPEDFRAHLGGLGRWLTWMEEHRSEEVVSDYCDPVTGQCYGKPLRGWASPHMAVPSSGPVAWSTAQALSCVLRMRGTVRRLLHVDVLEEFGGKSNGGAPRYAAWDGLLDTDLGDPAAEHCRTLKDVLEERMVRPFTDPVSLTGSSASMPNVGAAYSSILFGPPGTAKSTITEALAERMGWDFVVVDTADFLADGLTNVASRIRYVFDRLASLTDCVILFDEIEEFCLDRETPGLGMESRLLTTSMLTQLNDLRRAKRSVFFLATNRLRAFDSAIIRPGRFDMQLFVGTPNLESRVIQLRGRLAAVPASEDAKEEAVEAFRSYLGSVWDEDAMFFNYLEGLQFASACADVVATGNPLTEERMSKILKAQAVVMTVRGQVREEYKASMGLYRL